MAEQFFNVLPEKFSKKRQTLDVPKKPVSSSEAGLTPEAMSQTVEKGLGDVEVALAHWTTSLELLDKKIPHNDLLMEDRSMSFNVYRNYVCSCIYELEAEKEELLMMKKGLDQMLADA